MTLAIIPTFLRTPRDLAVALTCVASLRRTAPAAEVLVVDDCSPAAELLDELEVTGVRLHRKPDNEGFSTTVNVGLREALERGADAVLVNADVEFIDDGWLDRMLARTNEHDDEPAAVVGARLLYPNGLIQHAGIFFSLLSRTFGHIYQYAPNDLPEAARVRTCPVTGALQLIRHETLAGVGLYDEDFRMGYEDVDYCLRVFLSGRSCVMAPDVRAVHYESMFRGEATPKIERWQEESWQTFRRKHAQTRLAAFVPSLT